MRVATAAVASLALLLVACTAAPAKPSPSASLGLTDLSSFKLPSPSPTPPSTPIVLTPRTPKPTPAPTVTTAPTATPAVTLTPSPTPTLQSLVPASPFAGATPAADCVNGWQEPAAGSIEYETALQMIQEHMNVTGPWTVDEMRYFTGPDVPWILDPHFDVVDYWYVKASRTDDSFFHARWLLEYRSADRQGVVAVAPYGTSGYSSPDWTAFTGDGTAQIYTDLPGTWAGVPYDFVTGAGDSGQPGLPDQVIGCLSGT